MHVHTYIQFYLIAVLLSDKTFVCFRKTWTSQALSGLEQ